MNRIDNSNSDIEKLRSLLLKDDIEKIRELDRRVESIYDSDEFRDIVTKSISKEIEKNRDSMVDALYPIIGAMISKYVTQAIKEMMQNINQKIEQGLSFDRYRRKVKSKITGVSEMELLVKDSTLSIVSSLFIIQKESGLLIAKAELDDKSIDDPYMVASMASAIRDFINDWIKSNKSQTEVQILSYGDATLYIESAGSVYIIAFLNDEPDFKLRKSINSFFASIIKEYSLFFQTFDGDDRAWQIEQLSSKMYNYLNLQTTPTREKSVDKKRNHTKYILYLILIVSTIYIANILNTKYLEYRLETLIKDKTNQDIEISSIDGSLVLKGYIDKLKSVDEIESIIKTQTKIPIKNKLLVPIRNILDIVKSKDDEIAIINRKNRKSITRINRRVKYLNKQLNRSQHQIYKLQRNSIKYIEIFKKVDIEKSIYQKLDKIFENNPFYIKDDKSLDFQNLHIFNIGEAKYNLDSIKIVGENFEKYISILSDYREYIDTIIIEGHTDSDGDEDKNIKLSQERAFWVREYLYQLPLVEDSFINPFIEIDGLGSRYPIIKNGVEDKNASRRIKIKLKLKDKI